MKMNTVKKNMAVWINHREAVLVTIEDETEAVEVINSTDADRHTRASGGHRTKDNVQSVSSEQKGERRRDQALDRYYNQVADAVVLARSLYLFGPGEAKHEFKHVLEDRTDTRGVKINMESADAMTRNQVVAKARGHFGPEVPRGR